MQNKLHGDYESLKKYSFIDWHTKTNVPNVERKKKFVRQSDEQTNTWEHRDLIDYNQQNYKSERHVHNNIIGSGDYEAPSKGHNDVAHNNRTKGW